MITHLLDFGDSSRALEQGTAGGACALGSARPFCAGGVGNYGLGATARDRAVPRLCQQQQTCRTVVTTPFSAVGVCRDDAPQDARAGDGNVHAQLWDCRCGTVVATPPRTRARPGGSRHDSPTATVPQLCVHVAIPRARVLGGVVTTDPHS